MIDLDKKFKLSRFLQILEVTPSHAVVANGISGTRQILGNDGVEELRLFSTGPMTFDEWCAKSGKSGDEALNHFQYFVMKSFIAPADLDEETAIRLGFDLAGSRAALEHSHAGSQTLGEVARLRVLVVGGCFSPQWIKSWPNRVAGVEFQIETRFTWISGGAPPFTPDIVFFQPWTTPLMGSLFDEYAGLSTRQKRDRYRHAKESLTFDIERLRKKHPGSLLIVEGLPLPCFFPGGRSEFRNSTSLKKFIQSLNCHLAKRLGSEPNGMFLDVEDLFSREPKGRLFNDAKTPYAIHTPAGEMEGVTPEGVSMPGFGRPRHSTDLDAGQSLAEEILNCYLVWSGRGKIKCVVVDLDQTLWPGIAGETTEPPRERPFYINYRYGIYGGLHEALSILKSRGILLAICSKNDAKSALAHWKRLVSLAKKSNIRYFMKPGDFACHRINWNPKSDNIAEISKILQVETRSMLFIDDNPVEREEVRARYPEVVVFDGAPDSARRFLLENPRLQVNMLSKEGAARTELVKKQILREKARSKSRNEGAFLKSLKIQMTVTCPQKPSELARLCELTQRTTQFNTTQKTYDAATLGRKDLRVFGLYVKDRFADYGLVGACFVKDAAVENLVISCRAIGLRVEVPFLKEVLKSLPENGNGVTARIVKTERNLPCQSVFANAGFRDLGQGLFLYEAGL